MEQDITIVLCHGTFDVLHLGHVRFLEQARTLGDLLIVSVTDDPYVRFAKGPDRPRFTAAERCEMLEALTCVTSTWIVHGPDGIPAIEKFAPHIYAKGWDYASGTDLVFQRERDEVEVRGGRVVCIEQPRIWSTTALLNGVTHVAH